MKYGFRTISIIAALAVVTAGGVAESAVPTAGDVAVETQETGQTQTQALTDDSAAVEGEATPEDNGEQERERIRQAQQMLIDLGYLYGSADGFYGPMTASALKRFQNANSLEETGELNDETMQALSGIAEQVGDVKALQQRLIDLGYLRGVADGAFGERSQAAMKQFQAIHALEATGVPDDATREVLFSDGARALPKRLGAGSKGDAVIELQQKLIQYGFLSGEADGSYGVKTAAAVKRFQNHLVAQGKAEALGIEPSGEATAVTLLALYDPEYASYLNDVHAGDEGDEVKRVERRLAGLGYMDAEPDDIMDDYAVSAAEAFRTAAGLEGSAYDRAYIDALFAQDAPAAEHFVLHPIAYGDEGDAVREVQEALVCGGLTISMPDGIYGKGLVKGVETLREYLASIGSPRVFAYDDGEALSVEAQQLLSDGLLNDLPGAFNVTDTAMVLRVQRRLHTLYYLSKRNIDGAFGEKTQSALKDFQTANGLPTTGGADTATLNRLFSPDAAFKLLPYRVEVSIDKQRVYVYELQESGDYELIHTFLCSTGLGNTTPRGIYLDGGPVNVWHHFSKFDCWARYSFEIDGDIMFHSVIYSERNTDTLRESSLYGLGNKASHGCVRLAVKSAKWLFEHCAPGSLVIIIY